MPVILRKACESIRVTCHRYGYYFAYQLAELKTRYLPFECEGVSCPGCGAFHQHRGGK